MARTDFNTPRLHVSAPLAEGAMLALSPEQANYLVNVLRLKTGAPALVFNGRDGEFAVVARRSDAQGRFARHRRAGRGRRRRRPTSTFCSRR